MKIFEKIKKYHFQLRHLLVLLVILIVFQISITIVHKVSLTNFLKKTQDWYQFDSAEKLASLAATSLELLLENMPQRVMLDVEERRRIIQAFNIILTQQILQQHVEDLCILVSIDNQVIAIDNGQALYEYLLGNYHHLPPPDRPHDDAIRIYRKKSEFIRASEQIYAEVESKQTFHIFVPFVPRGEYMGALYMKNKPEFSFVTKEIISSYNELALIFIGLIVAGLLGMLYISSYTIKERDEVQAILYREREKQLKELIKYQKEALFTKRIYHTHHKAEKIMGFMKEDLHAMNHENMEEMKYRMSKYANFISRVIYDMKWYDPPLQTIRNPIFRTNLNEVIQFLVQNIFRRTSRSTGLARFELDLAPDLPSLSVNEFVIWEIIEPLIQNSVEHGGEEALVITIRTRFDAANHRIFLSIEDNGRGILPELLQENAIGVKRIFLEHTTTKTDSQNSGYGAYIAHEIAVQRCGWKLDANNLPQGGCVFSLEIPIEAS